MTDWFIAEIRLFAGNFAPVGWAFCDGQLLAINQNTALFSLLGTTYGGNGVTTFGLPNLKASVPVGGGQGPGLTDRVLGERGGASAVTLDASTMPAHAHSAGVASGGEPDSVDPGNAVLASAPFYGSGAAASLNAGAVSAAGGGQPHNNMPPYLAVSFIIALNGVFPPRS